MKFSANNVLRGLTVARVALIKNSPYILTGIGVCGVISTAVLASKATLRADSILREKSQVNDVFGVSSQTKIPPADAVKLTWQCYIPTVLVGAGSIACIIGAQAINSKRQAALATMYSVSELALKEYQDKVVETFGEKGQQKVKDGIAKDRMENDPVTTKEVIVTGTGDQLCYDSYSGRYFMSDIEKLRQIQNDINESILIAFGNEASLNEFYYAINLENIPSGYNVGWDTEHPMKLVFSSQIAKDGRPCLVVNYDVYKITDCPF